MNPEMQYPAYLEYVQCRKAKKQHVIEKSDLSRSLFYLYYYLVHQSI
jgi:ACT domain-containing protein